jgi:hypothetical protein
VNEFPDCLAQPVVALNTSPVDEESLHEMLARVAFLASQTPMGAGNAGVTLQRQGAPEAVDDRRGCQ